MDKLQELINTLSEDDKKEFRIFINRQKSKKNRKDLDLFELIADDVDAKVIQAKLYKTPNKVAYHTLRKRLLKHLTDFIVLKQIDDDTTSTSSITGLIALATYLFKNKSEEFAWRTLSKAEQTAIDNEHYELLNDIYQLQINKSDSDFAPDINKIYKKWESNKVLVDENERTNIAYNFIKKEINEIILKGEVKDVRGIIDELLVKYELNDTVFNRPEILYKVLELTRKVMLSRKDFYNFEPYIIKMYEELVAKHGFSKKNHFYKIHIQYMIGHILYRNRKFIASNTYLDKMLKSMLEYNKAYYKQFYPKHLMLSAANFAFMNKNDKAIELLDDIETVIYNKLTLEDQLNIKLNLAVYYGYGEHYKKCNFILQTLNHSDNWLMKKMGVEWVMKKNMIEIMIQYELENYEISLNRIRSFERNFAELFNHPLYGRANQFIQTLKTIITNPLLLKDSVFVEKVKSTLVKPDAATEDLQAMTFYAWLKAKMLNQSFYDVLLGIANAKYETN